MTTLHFKATVRAVAGPELTRLGFSETKVLQTGAVRFERLIRGHRQAVTFESLDSLGALGMKAFHFSLQAAKQPMGIQSMSLKGGKMMWTYTTQEKLTVHLSDCMTVLLGDGLVWLDTYTPGNVPDWAHLVDTFVTPVLTRAGFTRHAPAPVDMAAFSLESDLSQWHLHIDFQKPGLVEAGLIEIGAGNSIRSTDWPTSHYQDEAELEQAVQRMAEAFGSTLPDLMGRP